MDMSVPELEGADKLTKRQRKRILLKQRQEKNRLLREKGEFKKPKNTKANVERNSKIAEWGTVKKNSSKSRISSLPSSGPSDRHLFGYACKKLKGKATPDQRYSQVAQVTEGKFDAVIGSSSYKPYGQKIRTKEHKPYAEFKATEYVDGTLRKPGAVHIDRCGGGVNLSDLLIPDKLYLKKCKVTGKRVLVTHKKDEKPVRTSNKEIRLARQKARQDRKMAA